jgi:hypothetical protein
MARRHSILYPPTLGPSPGRSHPRVPNNRLAKPMFCVPGWSQTRQACLVPMSCPVGLLPDLEAAKKLSWYEPVYLRARNTRCAGAGHMPGSEAIQTPVSRSRVCPLSPVSPSLTALLCCPLSRPERVRLLCTLLWHSLLLIRTIPNLPHSTYWLAAPTSVPSNQVRWLRAAGTLGDFFGPAFSIWAVKPSIQCLGVGFAGYFDTEYLVVRT